MNNLLCLLAVTAMAQPPSPTFRTGTELIQVSVVAQDARGKPVMDLRREEFTLFDNGSPREIGTFALEKAQVAAPGLTVPNTFSNRIAPSASEGSGSHAGYSVILIDNILASFGDPDTQEEGSPLARIQALKVLRSMPPDEKIAIYATKRQLQIICEFTADRDLLEQRLKVWMPSPDNPDTSAQAYKDALAGAPRLAGPAYAAAVQRQLEDSSRVDMMLRNSGDDDILKQVADHLAGIPGRKNLIWLSNRFFMSPAALQKFNRANTAIYPVDMDGVCRVCSPRPIAAMNAIATATGGLAYYNRNDIDAAIREAIDDGRVTYTLGFYQSGGDSPSRIHQLTVKVSRPAVTLRYRTSYQIGAPKLQAATAAELIAALHRPANETAIPFQVSASRRGDELNLEIKLDAASLDLVQQDGRWTARIESLAQFMTAEGKAAGTEDPLTMTLKLRQATYDTALKDGLLYRRKLGIPPGAVELRLLFANLSADKIGTFAIPLSEIKGDTDAK